MILAEEPAADSLQRELSKAGTDSARLMLNIQLSNSLALTDYKAALTHATTAVQLAERTGNSNWMITAYKVAGTVCMHMGLNDLSVRYFNLQYKQAEHQGRKLDMGGAYFNLSAVRLALEDFVKAREFILKADTLLRQGYAEAGLPFPEVIELVFRMNLGNILLHLDQFAAADSVLSLSAEMALKNSDYKGRQVSIYHLQGMLFLRMKDAGKALSALDQARQLALSLGDVSGHTATCQTMGQAYELQGEDAAAIRSYSEGYRSAEAINALALQVFMAESLYKLYQKRGEGDSSIRYFDLYTRLKEQLKSDKAREELMREDLMRAYRRMESDLRQRTDAGKRNLQYLSTILLAIAIVTTLGTIAYRRRYRRVQLERVRRDLESRRLALEAERLQAELEQRDVELERIGYELKKQQLIESLVGISDGADLQRKPSTASGEGGVAGQPYTVPQTRAWEEFEFRFQQIHSGFYDRLSQAYPDLTLNERRLCAFLRLDMTTKEISDITGQSIAAINMARIRLRRKLGLTHDDTGLFEFLSSL